MTESGGGRMRSTAVSSSSITRYGQNSIASGAFHRSDNGTRRRTDGEANTSLSRLSTDSVSRMQSGSRSSVRSLSIANESMQSLLSDIKDVYSERLRKLEISAKPGEDTNKVSMPLIK